VLLYDLGQVEAHYGPFGDSVNLGAKKVHGLGLIYHRLGNQFGQTLELKRCVSNGSLFRSLLR
jgi:hypothetical protein